MTSLQLWYEDFQQFLESNRCSPWWWKPPRQTCIQIQSKRERGNWLPATSSQKKYVAKDRQTTLRQKIAAFRDTNHSGCLLRRGAFQTRIIIRAQRNTVYQKSYNEQNYLFSKLMDIRVTVGGDRRVTYTIPPLGKVCRTAFRKCYGLSENKIRVLLKIIHLDNPSVEPDQRGHRTARKFLPPVKKTWW